MVEQLRPAWQVLSAKARETDLAKQQAKEARAAFKDQDERLKPLVNALRPLNQEERQKFVKEALAVGEKIASSRRETAQAKIQQQEKARRSRGTDRSR